MKTTGELCFAVIGILILWLFPAGASPLYPVKIGSINPRILVDQNDAPFLMVGDSPQSIVVNLSPSDAAFYLGDRATNGFNTVLVDAICTTYTGGPANASLLNGTLPFTNVIKGTSSYNLTTPNEAYFAYLDQLINLAATNGIEVMLDPIETGGWLTTMLDNGTNICRAYGRYLGNRYKNFPNLIWCSGNDFQTWTNPANDAVVLAVAQGIRDEDTNHLQTVELEYFASSSLDDPQWAPLVGLNLAYTYYPTYAEMLHACRQSANTPVFMGEAYYDLEVNDAGPPSHIDHGTPGTLRRQEYWTMLSGAAGQLYGNDYTWQFKAGWQQNLDTVGVTQLNYMASLFSSVAWSDLVPDTNHTAVTSGFGTHENNTGTIAADTYLTAATTPDGRLAIAYMPTVRTISIAMTKLQNDITARWFDPSANTFTTIAGSPFSNMGTRNFTPSGNNAAGDVDWVLILTASAMTKPTVTITAPVGGQQCSNATFTVQGTAADNVGVAAVYYSLNDALWTNATTANGWTNWTASLTLISGANSLQIFAVDASGNCSGTNTINFEYVVPMPLSVQVFGLGTANPSWGSVRVTSLGTTNPKWSLVNPGDNSTLLAVNENYVLAATPAPGFVFTNWSDASGNPITNSPILQFTMTTSLALIANFVDVAPPTQIVQTPTPNQQCSNVIFIVQGTAADNVGVAAVYYSLNGTPWTTATTANSWTNWTATLDLIPGTNTLAAYALDTSGNVSATNTVRMDYVVTNQLGVSVVGLGKITPNYSNAWLELGRNYSITGAPASGFVFSNWTSNFGLMTNKASLKFMMQSNFTLQATFVDVTKPQLTITAPVSGQRMTSAQANVKGTASDNWGVSNVWFKIDASDWSLANTTNSWTNWAVTLPLNSGTNKVLAYAMDLGGNFSATNSVSFYSSNTFPLQLNIDIQSELPKSLVFGLPTAAGMTGRILVSTNLMNWDLLTNFTGTNPSLNLFNESSPGVNQRFYRAVAP